MRAWFIGLMTLVPLGVLGASCALGTFEKIEPKPDAGIELECEHARVPLPPNLEDANNGDAVSQGDIEFTTAVQILRLKRSADAGALGLDLDRYCSCQGEPPSCIAPEGQDPELSCDLTHGRDNQVAGVFRLIEAVLLFDDEGDQLSELYSNFAYLGQWSVLLRVTGYNGLPNDPKVRVEWYPSGGMPGPKWQGTDVWPIVPSCLDDAGTGPDGGLLARYADNDAYVTDGVLVFALAETEMIATNGINRLSLIISDGTGMARIVSGPTGFALHEGVLAGRMKLENLFKMVSEFRDHNGAAFCATNTNPYWDATRQLFCRGLDIQVGSPQPNKKCDAMSIAVGFEAEPATTGNIEMPDASDEQATCPPGTDMLSLFRDSGCPPPPPRPDASDGAIDGPNDTDAALDAEIDATDAPAD